ncbi:hypothetical protein TNCV_1736721 [Trichonephila clavipes]|nr:hypothetical protein TNCV_1736721 [Trichonephila clavipes]
MGVSYIRFQILVHHLEKDRKRTLPAPRLLREAPATHGPRIRQRSRITRQTCNNFSYWTSDCPSQNMPKIKVSCTEVFKPCQGVSKIRSPGIVRQSYGYYRGSMRNSHSCTVI